MPRFEDDEFAVAFVAANKPSAKTRRMDYIAKAERETDPQRKLHLLKPRRISGLAAATPIVSAAASAWSTDPGLTRSSPMRPTARN